MSCIVKLKPYDENRFFHIPSYASPHSAGKDIKASITESIEIKPHSGALIPTNLCVEIPPKYSIEVPTIKGVFGEKVTYETRYTGFELELQVRSKSGLSNKKKLILTNGIGTIDSDYRGEIKVALFNVSDEVQYIYPEESIAQIVLAPMVRFDWEIVDKLSETERNENGFGMQTKAKEGLSLVSFTTYTSCARYGYCLKCGHHEMVLTKDGNHMGDDIISKKCNNCGFVVKYDVLTYFDHINRNDTSSFLIPLQFEPKLPTEKDIEVIQSADGGQTAPSDIELFYLRNGK